MDVINCNNKESAINTQDNQWQADPKYKPDKESTWNYPAAHDGWIHAHNCIRGEIRDFTGSLQSVKKYFPSLPSWAVMAIQQVWHEHEAHVHSHHKSEDLIMTPFLSTRIRLPEKIESDHKIICDRIDDINQTIRELKEGDSADELLRGLKVYEETLLPHFLEEENIALPLMRCYFTKKEVAKVIQKMLSSSSAKSEMGSFIHYQTEQGFKEHFMKQEGIPGFVWFLLVFRPKYNYFLENVMKLIDALKSGKKPETRPSCWCV